MKKQLIYSGVFAMLLLGVTAGVIAANEAGATESSAGETTSISGLSNNSTQKIGDKSENVFVITDADGAVRSKFIGSTLYSGTAELPFKYSIQYYLDGAEISAAELAGKSGHVKMVYTFESTASYGGAKVPFVVLSGVQLDGAKFRNVKVSSGKIVSEGDSYTVIGYTLAGVNADLGTNFLPEEFSVEADVTSFELGTVYSVATDELFSEIDTSKLSDVDSLVASVNQLSDGLDQIISGASSLSEGLATALSGAKALNTGAAALSEGISSAATGAGELSDGINYLTSTYNSQLQSGARALVASTLTSVNTALSPYTAILANYGIDLPLTTETYASAIPTIITILNSSSSNSDLTDTLAQAKSLIDLGLGIIGYTQAVGGDIATGASELASGLATMNAKAPELVSGTASLVSGLDQLYSGSVTLKSGLATFKTTGIDKLVDFANNDLAGFARNVRQMVAAANNYHSFDSSSAISVKFIVKTASVK